MKQTKKSKDTFPIKLLTWLINISVVTISLVFFTVFLTACDDLGSTQFGDVNNKDVTPSNEFETNMSQQNPRNVYKTLDEALASVVNHIPGFGGFFVREDGTLIVNIANPHIEDLYEFNERNQAVDILQNRFDQLFGKRFTDRFDISQLEFVEAAFDYRQLNEWRKKIRMRVSDIPDLVFIDIYDEKNRIRIGVEQIDKYQIHSVLKELEIPTEAVLIVFAEPLKLDVGLNELNNKKKSSSLETHSVSPANSAEPLLDDSDKFVGGIEVIGEFACTLGLNVNWGGIVGFVTASHCTQYWFANDNTSFSHSGELIGYAEFDRQTTQDDGWCPVGHFCRYSSAVLVQYSPTALQDVEIGYIARTTGLNSNILDDPYGFEITESIVWPYPSQELNMVGKSSGWTRGDVITGCKDFYLSLNNYPDHLDTDTMLICVFHATYDSQTGDSGAPIFDNGSYLYNSQATFQGIHIGRFNGNAVYSLAYYSVGLNEVGREPECVYNPGGRILSDVCDEPFYGPYEYRAWPYQYP